MKKRVRRFRYQNFWCAVRRVHPMGSDAWMCSFSQVDARKRYKFRAATLRGVFTRLRMRIAEENNPKIREVNSKMLRNDDEILKDAFVKLGGSAKSAAKAVEEFHKGFPKFKDYRSKP